MKKGQTLWYLLGKIRWDNSRSLESKGDAEISSSLIGEQVMDALRQIDQIAYVRFASVYRNFSEASDFQKFLGQELEK